MKTRLLVLGFCFLVGILFISGMEMNRPDEPRVSGICREMASTGDYAIASLNGEPFLEYPTFGYVPTALVMAVTPLANDFLGHLANMLLGFGTVLLTYWMAREMAGERIGLLSAFFLQTMVGFIGIQKRLTVDTPLVFFITLSLAGAYFSIHRPNRSWLYFSFIYLGMAGATLTKGLVGLGLPAAAIFFYVILQRNWKAIRHIHLLTGVLLFAAPVVFWAYAAGRTDGWDKVQEILRQSVYRFGILTKILPDLGDSPTINEAVPDHSQPPYYYLYVILPLTLPWCFLFVVLLWKRFVSREKMLNAFQWGPGCRYPLTWFLTMFLVLSASSAKRNLYLAPLYPAIAMLVAFGWDRLSESWSNARRREPVIAGALFALLVVGQFAGVRPKENEDNYRHLFAAAQQTEKPLPLYLMWPSESLRGAVVYYSGRRAPVIRSEEALAQLLQDPGEKLLLLFLRREKENPIQKIQNRKFAELAREEQKNDITYLYRVSGE